MSVNILIITHDNVGSSLINTALKMFGQLPLPTITVPIEHSDDPENIINKIRNVLTKLKNSEGVLILTDLFGSTPSNIARQLQLNSQTVKIVTGINLPMLIKVMNYPTLCLNKLAEKAICGGKEGVLNCEEIVN